jgi:prepilin-type N-terminal cleavage/methylation domain-containing protein
MKAGFSLIELLIVLSVISALGATMIPAVGSWHKRHALMLEGEKLRLFLERARLVALTHDSTIAVRFKPPQLIATTTTTTPLFSYTPRSGISIKNRGEELKPVIFYATMTSTPTTLILSTRNAECAVVVSLRGRIRNGCL